MYRKRMLFGGMAAAMLFAGSFSFAQAEAEDDANEDYEDVPEMALSGYGPKKVTICHRGKTITVSAAAVRAHLAHGDSLGKCPPRPLMVTICHKGTTKMIPIFEAWRHMAHGDHTGKCRPKALSWYYQWQGWGWPRFSWSR